MQFTTPFISYSEPPPMTNRILNYHFEPITQEPSQLVDAVTTADGTIQSGTLVTPSGKLYPIIIGVHRFVE
jgi:hypothetical protein